MNRLVSLHLSLFLTLSCTTPQRERTPARRHQDAAPGADGGETGETNNRDPKEEGVITGNGSGGVPDRKLTDLPLDAKVHAFHEKLSAVEPTYGRIVKNFIFGQEVGRPKLQYYRTVPKDGASAKPDHDGEQCILKEREVRAYYDAKNNTITFCRGFFWTKESNFSKPASEEFQLTVIMHEYLHVLLDVVKMGYGDGEEEVVSGFDGLFQGMITATDAAAFKKAALALRSQLDRQVDRLGIWSQTEEVVGDYDQVPLLASDASVVYPVPKKFYDADYIAPHYLDYHLGKIFTDQLKSSADKLVASNLVRDGELGHRRAMNYYQMLFKMVNGDPDFKLGLVSLSTLNNAFDYQPNAALNARLIAPSALTPEIKKYLARAAGEDLATAWFRVLEWKPNTGANGANDYLIFVE